MPLPKLLTPHTDPCVLLAAPWVLAPRLAERALGLVDEWQRVTPSGYPAPALYIISGYRDPERNAEVGGAPNSCHVVCPSRAFDLRMGTIEGLDRQAQELWAILGGMWKLMGGRWGGDFSHDGAGINEREMNHFDLGPCLP